MRKVIYLVGVMLAVWLVVSACGEGQQQTKESAPKGKVIRIAYE